MVEGRPIAEQRRQVIRGERQQEQNFILAEVGRREAGNRGPEFSQPNFEGAPATVVFQHLQACPFFFPPVDDEEEVVGFELQLPALGVGAVDNHENQSLGVPPGFSPIGAEVDRVLITFAWRSSDGSFQMRLG